MICTTYEMVHKAACSFQRITDTEFSGHFCARRIILQVRNFIVTATKEQEAEEREVIERKAQHAPRSTAAYSTYQQTAATEGGGTHHEDPRYPTPLANGTSDETPRETKGNMAAALPPRGRVETPRAGAGDKETATSASRGPDMPPPPRSNSGIPRPLCQSELSSSRMTKRGCSNFCRSYGKRGCSNIPSSYTIVCLNLPMSYWEELKQTAGERG